MAISWLLSFGSVVVDVLSFIVIGFFIVCVYAVGDVLVAIGIFRIFVYLIMGIVCGLYVCDIILAHVIGAVLSFSIVVENERTVLVM